MITLKHGAIWAVQKEPGGRVVWKLNSSSCSPHSQACVLPLTQRSHSSAVGWGGGEGGFF